MITPRPGRIAPSPGTTKSTTFSCYPRRRLLRSTTYGVPPTSVLVQHICAHPTGLSVSRQNYATYRDLRGRDGLGYRSRDIWSASPAFRSDSTRQFSHTTATMTASKIDGTTIAKKIRERLGAEIQETQKLNPRYRPCLKIIQGRSVIVIETRTSVLTSDQWGRDQIRVRTFFDP